MDGPLKVKTAELIKIYAFNTYSINSKVEIKFDCKVYSSFLVNFSELDVSNTIKAIKTAENCTEEDIAFGKDYNSQKVWKILSKYWPKKQINSYRTPFFKEKLYITFGNYFRAVLAVEISQNSFRGHQQLNVGLGPVTAFCQTNYNQF